MIEVSEDLFDAGVLAGSALIGYELGGVGGAGVALIVSTVAIAFLLAISGVENE